MRQRAKLRARLPQGHSFDRVHRGSKPRRVETGAARLACRLIDRRHFFAGIRTCKDGPCHNYLMGKLFGKGPAGDPARESSAGKRIVRHPILAALLFGAVALAIFLMRLSTPATKFYDEGYYVPAAKAILVGAPNPNPEAPPLGKLLIAVAIKVAGDTPFGWRIAGSVCCALTLTPGFVWTYLLTRDFQIACIVAPLALLNNFFFGISRVEMVDAFL